MSNYVGLQADEAVDTPKNLKAIAIGGGEDALAVALYVDAAGTPTPLTSTMLGGNTTPTSIAGAGTQTATGSAVVLPTVAGKSVLLQSDPDNTDDILVGSASAQPIQLIPGQWLAADITNLNAFYLKRAVSGSPVLNYLVFN